MRLNNSLPPEKRGRAMGTERFGSVTLFLYTHYQFVRQIYAGFAATFGPIRPLAAHRVRKPIWKQHEPVHSSPDLAVFI